MRVKCRPACVVAAAVLGLGGCAGEPAARDAPACGGGGLIGDIERQSVDRLVPRSPVEAIGIEAAGEQREYGLVRLEALGPVAYDGYRPTVRYAAYDRADRFRRVYDLERGAAGAWVVSGWHECPVRPRYPRR